MHLIISLLIIHYSLSRFALSMPEPQFAQFVLAHETAFVHIAVDAVQVSFTGVLPHGYVTAVCKHRLLVGVLRYHDEVAV